MFGLSLDQGAVLLLRRAVAPFIQMPCFYGKMYISPDDLTFIAASTPNPIFHNPSVVTALRLRPSFFDNFNCDESLCLVLDLYHLYDILCQARDDDYLGIYGNGTHNQVSIVLLGSATLDFRDTDMDLVSIHHGQMNVPQFQYEYQVIVGIPSTPFRILIVELRQFGATVFAQLTDTLVTFSVGYAEVVLSKELEECIIGGAVSEDPVSLVFNLWHIEAMAHASAVSDIVWLLGQSNGLHVMLKCPVGERQPHVLLWLKPGGNEQTPANSFSPLPSNHKCKSPTRDEVRYIEVSVLLSLTVQLYTVKLQLMLKCKVSK